MLNTSSQNCIRAPAASPGGGTPCQSHNPAALLGLRFAQIRFASGFHGSGYGILLAHGKFLAAVRPFRGPVPHLPRLALRIIPALTGLPPKKIACLLACFWRE